MRWVRLDQTLKQHEHLIDKHEDRLETIQQDLIDIKTRLGIKDLTNGQVVEYQKNLADAIVLEREERKEQDSLLRSELKSIDEKTWWILGSVIFEIVIGIAIAIIGGLL